MTRKQLVFGLVAIAVIALGVIAYLVLFPSTADMALPSGNEQAGVVLSPQDRTLGNPKAPILMVEYAAPTCPVCARFDMDVFPLLKKNYIDTGKVYYVFRVYLLQGADGAVEAMARCLPANSYFSFIDMMYRNQSKWDPDGYDIPDIHAALVQMGRVAGMSADKVDQCIGDKTMGARINQVAADSVTRYGVNGTPTFVIDGQVYPRPFGWDEMKNLLDGLLKKH